MLEKIGLPAKPSMRGSNWVVDASHCQGCSSQFTFINRKHHCRRCGGIFCGTCTQQRMVLRGQGDSPVRICDPCKKLEEAARFELRHGYKNKAGRGGSKLTSKHEDELLNQILGSDGKQSSLSSSSIASNLERGASSASVSNLDEEPIGQDGKGCSLEELLQQALEEKKKYKILKGEGKPEEALRAFKRGKELEREAKALELALRKSQRKALSSNSSASIQKANDEPEEFCRKRKVSSQMDKERNENLSAELRELGWSDADLHNADKKPTKISLEGELSGLIGEIHKKSGPSKGTSSINKTEVIALKKKALMFKREGKLVEAKEELKRAKILEQQLEEQEFLAGAEDSDDELSSIINNMEDDKQDDISLQYAQEARFDLDNLISGSDDLGLDGGSEVTDEDMDDPEIAAALHSLGWTEDSKNPDITAEATGVQSATVDREVLINKALSLKKDAVRQKRSGNLEAAMTLLKKAKLLERDAENLQSERSSLIGANPITQNILISQSAEMSSSMEVDDGLVGSLKHVDGKLPAKSKIAIQKELLNLKKMALALRREGRIDEAEKELKKGRVLERQLEEMENTVKVRATSVNVGSKVTDMVYERSSKSGAIVLEEEDDEADVTEQDMHDPALLSLLENLGWKDEEEKFGNMQLRPLKEIDNCSDLATESSVVQLPPATSFAPKRSKAEIQRELLGLKRKALTLRRQGEAEEAEEMLRMAKVLEAQLAEIEASKRDDLPYSAKGKEPDDFGSLGVHEAQRNKHSLQESQTRKLPQKTLVEENEGELGAFIPSLLSQMNNLGSNLSKPSEQSSNHSEQVADLSVTSATSEILVSAPKNKAEIQRELLGLKRRALNLRRQGQATEAEEVLRMANVLETQMKEITDPNMEKVRNMIAEEEVKLGDESLAGSFPQSGQSINLVDLLSGDDRQNSQSPIEEMEIKDTSQSTPTNNPYIQPGTSNFPNKEIGIHDEILYDHRKELNTIEKNDANAGTISDSLDSQNNIQHEILVRKRRAVTLKREGKLAEAREELRQAKLLEKSQQVNTVLPDAGSSDVSVSTSIRLPVVQEDRKLTQGPKSMTGRDRFKLQQESLSHKRQALKLRREGRMEEAEVEFELAKALESQLEESSGVDSSNLHQSVDATVGNDDLGVEDFLDPQLLSALKAVGLQDAGIIPEASNRSEGARQTLGKNAIASQEKSQPNDDSNETVSQEKSQLEERIKAEKIKAVNLKRAGKQAEALDALRRAKLYEKKLNSLS